jgi:hypothetical protein
VTLPPTPPVLDGASAVEKYLAPGERVITSVRRHWAEHFWSAVAVFGGLVLVMFLDTALSLTPLVRNLLWLAWLAVALYFGWRIIEWSVRLFVITNKRFMEVSGIVTRNVAMMPLTRVTDMRYERTLLGRTLGYGTFILESAGQDQALSRIDYLPNPDELYREVNTLLFSPQ